MKICKINRLKINLTLDNIFRDFIIVKFSTSENYIKYGALILDELSYALEAKSIVFEGGKSFYALFEKEKIEKIDLSKSLEKLESGETLFYKLLNTTEISEIANHTIAQLLINSLSNPKNNKLSFNNLTGKLYLFSPNFFKISKTKDREQVFKIVALELNIASDLSFQLNVKTFSSVLLSKHMDFSKKKFSEFPKYTFVHSTGTLRRVLASDNNIQGENQFIQKQTTRNGVLEKNLIPFLSFKNLQEFNDSKIGLLNLIIQRIEEKLFDYLSIELTELPVEKTIRYNSSFNIAGFDKNIYLLDLIKDEDSGDYINQVKSSLKRLLPKANVKIVKKENKNGYNLNLIHNKSYYTRYGKKDPYKSSLISQHFTFEDFTIDSNATLKALIIESIIRNDIKNNQISITNWEKYEFKEKWIFGARLNEQFCFLTIHPNGNLKFEIFEPNLFNQTEFDMLCKAFEENNNVEFLVKDEKGNINLINKTPFYTIPNYGLLFKKLHNESIPLKLSRIDAIKYLSEIVENVKNGDEIIARINKIEHWSKKSLLDCFENRTDKKKFAEKIKTETGEILKSYFRDKTRYEILDSQLDIHILRENEKLYYYVGIKGEGIQQQISRASTIREIESYEGSEIIFDRLTSLMNVDFVKNGELTVFPFPIKYLREWVKQNF
ncbi:Uncharacterised protein [Chryseobacterium taklimakanense]|uniref:Uncharacterized protein n=1 Tax=Chryseobacterium taklimakanense TaxID=536441 RepID=A0A239XX26_9FLAO|nr:hypothetical protein [Chryseobacterium taklimakanense]SNV51197.1 Uncharacterised protein [Chryseobacterium taklimakanense]